MEDAYIVKGGKKLKGEVVLSGAKNVALKTIIAALLFDSKVILQNVPRIGDVEELIHLIEKLGVKTRFIDKNILEIDSAGLKSNKVDFLHASRIRVSFLLFAPLLHRFEECFIPNPGGCRIGARPIDRIIEGMGSLGAETNYNHETGYYEAKMEKKPQGSYTFQKQTHTGTELLIMFSVLGSESVTIVNPAYEPEIDELISFLNESGARIKREKKRIRIDGVSSLKQKRPFTIFSDRNEAVTFATLGIATRGEVVLKNISPAFIKAFLEKVKETGSTLSLDEKNSSIKFSYKKNIAPVDIVTSVYPGFMTDWQPNWAVLMTQSTGVSTIHERVFENRFSYVEELLKLGANIEYITPQVRNPQKFYEFNYEKNKPYQQAIRIHGGPKLHGGALSVTDLRAGATLVIASLIASGESAVIGASIIERGYENFVEKASFLGAEIKRV